MRPPTTQPSRQSVSGLSLIPHAISIKHHLLPMEKSAAGCFLASGSFGAPSTKYAARFIEGANFPLLAKFSPASEDLSSLPERHPRPQYAGQGGKRRKRGRRKRGRDPFLSPSTRLFSRFAARAKGKFQPQLLCHPHLPVVGHQAVRQQPDGTAMHRFDHNPIEVKKKVCVPFCVSG